MAYGVLVLEKECELWNRGRWRMMGWDDVVDPCGGGGRRGGAERLGRG